MNNQKEIYKFALQYALKKIEENMEVLRDSFPFVTVNGKWEICREEDWDSNIFSNGYWCNGFRIGMLWLAYKVTKNNKFKRKAYELYKLIEPRKNSNKTHDLGFLFYPSFCIKQIAYSILESLSKNYLSVELDSQAGILLQGCFHKPNNIAIDSSLIFGEYYYMEGLVKLITGGAKV